MKKILFLYTGGRAKRLSDQTSTYAKDFFYGYHIFQELSYDVEFVERIIPDHKPRKLNYRWLAAHNEWAAGQLTMGNNAPFFLPHLQKLKEADIIIAIGDSIALAPEYYKLRGWIDAKIIHVSMGFINYWMNSESNIWMKSGIRRWYYERFLSQADAIITLGVAEQDLFTEHFPKLEDKLRFIPFGIDTDFWKTAPEKEKDIDVLFVGNDMRRDYTLLEELPKHFPDLNFAYVSKRLSFEKLKKIDNVTYYSGSWRGLERTDEDIRDLYHRSKILINPILETYQPSGQSVTLQAMACGVPVLISEFKGFWDPSKYSSDDIIIVKHTLNDWVHSIDEVLKDEKLRMKLSENGKVLTNRYFSANDMVRRYTEVITEISN